MVVIAQSHYSTLVNTLEPYAQTFKVHSFCTYLVCANDTKYLLL